MRANSAGTVEFRLREEYFKRLLGRSMSFIRVANHDLNSTAPPGIFSYLRSLACSLINIPLQQICNAYNNMFHPMPIHENVLKIFLDLPELPWLVILRHLNREGLHCWQMSCHQFHDLVKKYRCSISRHVVHVGFVRLEDGAIFVVGRRRNLCLNQNELAASVSKVKFRFLTFRHFGTPTAEQFLIPLIRCNKLEIRLETPVLEADYGELRTIVQQVADHGEIESLVLMVRVFGDRVALQTELDEIAAGGKTLDPKRTVITVLPN